MRDVSIRAGLAFSLDMTDKRLLLFDIDSTLVSTGGAGVVSLKRVIAKRHGVQDDLHDIEIAGCTDSGIATDILKKYGEPQNEEAVHKFLDEYIGFLSETVATTNGQILPGMFEILTQMKTRPDRVLGLLTGNVKRGAKIKLQHYGLWDFFEFGAFADDHHDRNQLGEFARTRAHEKHGHEFDAARIDVIGDTPRDIACGRAFGARTVAVATGTWSREQLAEHQPDFLFDDFSDVGEVMRVLGW